MEPQTLLFNDFIGQFTKGEVPRSIIENWIRGCAGNHRDCNPVSLKEGNVQQELAAESLRDISDTHRQALPSRLLKLEVVDQRRTFRLVNTKQEIVTQTRYATLSHCWGTKPWDRNLILNQVNLATLSTPQPVNNLPKTFRNAFMVLERLQLEYLWIDRFCIFKILKMTGLQRLQICITSIGTPLFVSQHWASKMMMGDYSSAVIRLLSAFQWLISPSGYQISPNLTLACRVWLSSEMQTSNLLRCRSGDGFFKKGFWLLEFFTLEKVRSYDSAKLPSAPKLSRLLTSGSASLFCSLIPFTSVGLCGRLLLDPTPPPPPSFENPIDCILIEWYCLLNY